MDLVAVDKYGEMVYSGNILGILPDGTFELYYNINTTIGLKLDHRGVLIKGDKSK